MTAPVRLTVVLEFDTPQDCQEWLDEHKNGWCSDVPLWSTARLVSTSRGSDWQQTQVKPLPVPPGYVPIPNPPAPSMSEDDAIEAAVGVLREHMHPGRVWYATAKVLDALGWPKGTPLTGGSAPRRDSASVHSANP